MNENEFRAYAAKEGYREPETRSQPPNKLFDTHSHKDDLLVLVTEGELTVDYGSKAGAFGPGDMCYVAPGVDHTDQAGPAGASYVLAWRAT